MDTKRNSQEYIDGINKFVNFAARTTRHGRISCPCRNYRYKNMFDVDCGFIMWCGFIIRGEALGNMQIVGFILY